MFHNPFTSLMRFNKPTWNSTWKPCLKESTDTLRQIALDTEDDFLRLGERMQEFYERAKKMSSFSSQVASRLSAEDMTQGIRMLDTIFKKAKNQTKRSADYTAKLEQMLEKLMSIEGLLSGFDKTVRSLYVLCNFIKIENARLGKHGSGFDTLGDDVRKLACTIASKSLDLLEQSTSLSQLIRHYLKMIADYETQQQMQAQLVLSRSSNNLSAMIEECGRASDTMKLITLQWESISRSIGEMVSSMQFHDITRQRLEHIHDALMEMIGGENDRRESIKNGRSKHSISILTTTKIHRNAGSLSKMAEILSICELQKAQLIHADKDLLAAVERIGNNLQKIADNVLATSEEIQKTASVSNGDNQSFLQKLEADLISLADAMATYGALDRDLSSYMKTATAAIIQMDSFIHDIEKIGIEMHMVALNASIQSAHIGHSGATLGVLAESILRLSDSTVHEIEDVSHVLSDVVEEARLLSRQDKNETREDYDILAKGVDCRFEPLIHPIRTMNDEVTILLAGIDQEGKGLAKDIKASIENLAIQKKMNSGIRDVVSNLTGLIVDMRKVIPGMNEIQRDTGLNDLLERYTMEQERQVHQYLTISTSTSVASNAVAMATGMKKKEGIFEEAMPKVELAAATSDHVQDLGDNVELF